MKRSTLSERALVLAPRGRDAPLAASILREAGFEASICASLAELIADLDDGAAFIVVTDEVLATADLAPLAKWLSDQEDWSDVPFILLTNRGGGLERNPTSRRYLEILGNVTFLERPFHPTTLVSLARSALRGRRRQYEARARLNALRESEERLQALNLDLERKVIERSQARGRTWQVSPDLMGALNSAGHFETSNPAWLTVLGWSEEEVARTSIFDLLHPDDVERTRVAFKLTQIGEPAIRFPNRYRHKNGGYRWISWVGVPDDGMVYCTGRDITDEVAQAEALAQRTAERDRLWTLSEDMLARADYTGMMSAVSPAWTRILGWSEDQLLSRPYASFMHPDDMGATLDAIAAMARTGRPARFENRIATSNDDWKPIEWTVAPEADGANFIAVGRDLSIVKAKEAELRAVEEQLRQSQKLEIVGQLTGGVAHDFNNLLTIIKSSTALLQRPGLEEKRRQRYVDAISETADRAAKLTGQLLAFARRQALRPEVFDAVERVGAITEMLRNLMGSRIRIVTELSNEKCWIKADLAQFETALVNMAVNARDAMDGEGTLTINVGAAARDTPGKGGGKQYDRFRAISITDTGEGIPVDNVAHIFEPFYTTKEVGKGTGLGLSQVYGFVKQSGGDIAVKSEPGVGTKFTLYFPYAEAGPDASEAHHRTLRVPIDAGGGKRILVVEDSNEVGRFSTQLLQDLGYETTWATSAGEALDILQEQNCFEAIFSDVVMPGMNGIELGREIRRLYPYLPVVLTSGYSDVLAEEGSHGFELLQKPYAVEDLSRILRRVTQKDGMNEPPLSSA